MTDKEILDHIMEMHSTIPDSLIRDSDYIQQGYRECLIDTQEFIERERARQ